jgi:hypothetical protein
MAWEAQDICQNIGIFINTRPCFFKNDKIYGYAECMHYGLFRTFLKIFQVRVWGYMFNFCLHNFFEQHLKINCSMNIIQNRLQVLWAT